MNSALLTNVMAGLDPAILLPLKGDVQTLSAHGAFAPDWAA